MDVKQQARELHQLMQAARYYLDLAGNRIAGREAVHIKRVGDRFGPDSIPALEDHEQLYLGADLASAAIRLWTIDERIDKPHWNKVEGYFGGADVATEDLRNHALNGAWLHAMLADNVGHVETHAVVSTNDAKVRAEQRRIDRQRVLGELTLGQVYVVLRRTATSKERHVKEFAATKAGSIRDIMDLAQSENCCVCLARDGKMTPADAGSMAMGGSDGIVGTSVCKAHAKEFQLLYSSTGWSMTKERLKAWHDSGCPPVVEFFSKTQ